MKTEYSAYEYADGKFRRRVYYYDDDGDVVMTEFPVYEDAPEVDEYSYYDGPNDSEPEEDA